MATVPRDIIANLTYQLNQLSLASRRVVIRALENITYTDVADLRQKILEILEPIFGAATDDAAAYAANMYDEIREYELGKRINAVAQSMRNPVATEKAVRAFVNYLESGGMERIKQLLADRMDYEIKKAAAECVQYNAKTDPAKPRFARVPTGSETCMFCIMLASRGFVYLSESSAGALDHFHPHCDCRVVPGFGDTEVDGYDPDALYDVWKGSGFNPNNKDKTSKPYKTKYAYEGDDNVPSFSNFNDVKAYLYDATSQADLEHRFTILGNIYGFQSEQMRSQSLKNVLKTASKRLSKE